MIRMTTMAAVAAALTCFTTLPTEAPAWGRDGHRMIAAIAESRLTPATLEKVSEILGPEQNLVSVATWADQIRPVRRESAPWHYVDIPLTVGKFTPERCPDGDCVTLIIDHFAEQLGSYEEMDKAEAEDALKFLVHFIGDQAQPLHNANDEGDLGGNRKAVNYFGRDMNLHSVWDSGIISRELEVGAMDSTAFAEQLNNAIRPESEQAWGDGGPIDWSNESHAIARDFGYSQWQSVMGEDYQRNVQGIVRVQLQKSGVRTAHVLNTVFDPAYDGIPEIQRELVLTENPTEGVKVERAPVFEEVTVP